MSEEVIDYSEKTREIYHQQHARIAQDQTAMERFIGMFSTEYFGVDPNFFSGKKVLDAGCGDTAKVIIAMSRMGAGEIHGIDLGQDFLPVAQDSMARHEIDTQKVHLHSGSVLALPFEDNSFDFVICHGVLLHLNSLDEVRAAFAELARVTRPGGQLYTVYGVVGGLLEGAIIPAVRDYYDSNPEFKKFIDHVSPGDFEAQAGFIREVMQRETGENVNLGALTALLDVDFCVMLQNLIQAPVRLPVDEAMVRELYAEHGFQAPKRLRRYVKRKNIRKYLAPFHYEHEHPFSRMIWGSGNLEMLGEKQN